MMGILIKFGQHEAMLELACKNDFKHVPKSVRFYLLTSLHRRLDEEDAALLNAPVLGPELAKTIRHLKRASAPGLDGLGPALYQLEQRLYSPLPPVPDEPWTRCMTNYSLQLPDVLYNRLTNCVILKCCEVKAPIRR
ncbi:uncharacterized protein PHALS_00026 [Plasmopara halstedii]|uniref:Uncharacterized protein n=1 Tax=Plasmopara halstedii TaxID=4781 RepID=A0A0P1ARM3_PLAHL|nr:uncharacterized protein PHALS_00026 [Plasmopara halstedii]CEG44263.1 hypothetical protein PHALS_00026 [Plasmopara halstedii]|eukprot:XP_024580632.1 hypothetical protein PHALS_00026 [Plasmopara halstedii]